MKDEKSLLALATIRQNRGISLQQIADSTKISVRALQAIESEEFQKLPGGIYNTSYIRQYARAIDYDEAAILAVYYNQSNGRDSDPTRPGGTGGPGGSGGRGVFGGYRPASNAV